MKLDDIIQRYLEIFPDDRAGLAMLLRQFEAGDRLLPGHGTSGAIVLSPDMTQVLMVHHKALDRWLQPGGHWEAGDTDPLAAARREAEEETAVDIDRSLPLDAERPLVPIHIETHPIPDNPRKGMPAHVHHDFRYAFVARSLELQARADEINECRWMGLEYLASTDLAVVLPRIRQLVGSS